LDRSAALPFIIGNYHVIMVAMNTRLTLDKTGRIVLPKPVREEMELLPGDTLELETSEEEITLRPVRGNASLHKKHGIWVYGVGEPLTDTVVQNTVAQLRHDRQEQILGKKR
jgi:AbrB family looped-hinge helix DNA binding protein